MLGSWGNDEVRIILAAAAMRFKNRLANSFEIWEHSFSQRWGRFFGYLVSLLFVKGGRGSKMVDFLRNYMDALAPYVKLI